MLRIERLAARSASDAHALRSVDLAVEKGEHVALIGASGAGKSTLIRCVNRLVEPESGAIFLGDLEITRLNARALRQARRRIGIVCGTARSDASR
jgi:phosphonate transport system ATP-binding protein